MPQVPTARGIKIRSASDAHLLFYAVHLQRLPIIQRRLDATERLEVTSGAVFVWEERSASSSNGTKSESDAGPAAGVISGIERWTDGLKWGPSRVRDDFLFYQEKDPSGDSILSDSLASQTMSHPYRKGHNRHPDLLIKQTYSVHYNPQVLEGKPPVEPARKWHLTAYQSATSADRLADVTSVPELQGITPPEGLFRKARIGKKREAPSAPHSAAGAAPSMPASMYPLEPYSSTQNGMGHRQGGHSASGSLENRVEHAREGPMASNGWREDSIGEMSSPHRPLLPQHHPQRAGQGGYPNRSGFPSPSTYPASHNGHGTQANGYHTAPYPPPSQYTSSHGHSAPHHSHSSSIGYGEPQSPYAQTRNDNGQIHGAYGGVSTRYPYPQQEIGYGHPPQGEYGRTPGTRDSPSITHAAPVMGDSLSNTLQHTHPPHHPHSTVNGQNAYDSYHQLNPGQRQHHTLDQSSHHSNGSSTQPPDTMAQVQQSHHSYSFSNGQHLPQSPHLHQGAPQMHHVQVDSRSYPYTPHQRPVMPHPQTNDFEHHRTLSQSSRPVAGDTDGMRTPPIGVTRIRRGLRKSDDITAPRPTMSRSPPSNHSVNGVSAGRQTGSGAIGGNGGRSQFSPYSRPIDAPGPRQHTTIIHHPNEHPPSFSSFENPYHSRGAFSQEDHNGSMHMRTPSAPHPFATPSAPSIPALPGLNHYAPPVPPQPPRTGNLQGPPLSEYYFTQGPSHNSGNAGGPLSFDHPDFSEADPPGAWTPSVPEASTVRSTPLQVHSAYPFPAGPLAAPQGSPQPQQQRSQDISNGAAGGGVPAMPVGAHIHGHIVPHPNPNSSPLLTQFQPMSTPLGSSRSGSSGGINGSPELMGLHQHLSSSTAGVLVTGAWDGSSGPARSEAPAPPRIDTSVLGGVDSSPVSVTAGGSGSTSSKLGPLTPSTTLVTRDPEDERVLDLLSRQITATASGARAGSDGGAVVVTGGSADGESTAKGGEQGL